MMRGYAIGLGAGTQVATLLAGELVGGPPDEFSRALLNGTGWVINLALAEPGQRRGRVHTRQRDRRRRRSDHDGVIAS